MLHDKEAMVKILNESIERTEGKAFEDWSWGDFVLVVTSALITERLGILTKGLAISMVSKEGHIEALIRLSQILNTTEGFESMKIVQRIEALDDRL